MTHARRPLLALVVAAALVAGCESTFNMAGSPAVAPLGQEGAVRAILAPGASGTTVTIDNPSALPEAVRAARTLEVAIAGRTLPVTRSPGGYYSFVVPAGTAFNPDVAGNWKVVFVLDDVGSQIVTLLTGSPVQFANPPVLTDPSPGFIVRGLELKLRANTEASIDKYQFTWAYSTTGTAPWMSIPGQGKEVEWTPPQAGNFFVKVDAVDRATQQSYSTVTPSALVFVTDGDEVITTTPTSGAIERGQPVDLAFNRPQGLRGDDLSYAWSVAASSQGPWTTVQGTGPAIQWLPTALGSYYVKTEVSSRSTGEVNTFVTPEAAVFVNEGRPIVTANPSAVLRGDRVGLDLNLTVPGNPPISWFYSRTGAVGGAWTSLSGTGKANSLVVNEAGTYHFRVDVPDASGAIKTFTTTEPVLNVAEGALPLIQTVPRNNIISQGGNTTLQLNARGVDETNYRYTWFASQSPSGGWMALPIESAREASLKTYDWDTSTEVTLPAGGTQIVMQPAGSYFIRVDAAEKTGSNVYTFTSSSPVVTIQNN